MHDAGAMDGGQRRGHPHRDSLQSRQHQRPTRGDDVVQADPVDVLRDQVRRVGAGICVEHLCGTEGCDAASRRDLVGEACPELRIGREVFFDHLDGHRTAGFVLAEVHHAHAADAEPTDDPVPADPGGVPWLEWHDPTRSIRCRLRSHVPVHHVFSDRSPPYQRRDH